MHLEPVERRKFRRLPCLIRSLSGRWVKFETCRLDPKPIQKPHVPIIVGGYAEAALRRAVRFGAGWYGFNRDPTSTKQMMVQLDAAFLNGGRKRDPQFQTL
jgi:alkanesulfonate monooxygenase SsuD/methylene tetrahydromethanopterin reductase-like flavin-dependent oxidoreductase (luciferase family)